MVDHAHNDLEAVRQLKAQYWRYIDTKQWQRFRSLFHDDARFDMSRPYDGPEAFVKSVSTRLQDAITVHHGHSAEIVFSGSAIARAIWPMFDYVEFDARAEEGPYAGTFGYEGYGYYEDEYRKGADGSWRIARLALKRIRVDTFTAPRRQASMLFAPRSSDWLEFRRDS